jgi:RHS repeat-associated protein
MLTGYRTYSEGVTGPTFRFYNVAVDGLGRLKSGWEQISYQGQNKLHILQYTYDMRSQLTNALITNIGGSPWIYDYHYRLDGNIDSKVVNVEGTTEYEYDGDIMASATGGESFTLTWDDNGRLTAKPAISFVYNWDGKLRSATIGPNSISLKYDPFGNRVIKNSSINGNRKYIIDISGELPTILLELDESGSIMKTYVHADSQILAQHDGDHTADKYFYLHDRLGSVRLIVDDTGAVRNSYTYNPFGEMFPTECAENVSNPFKFTGQWFDSEIEQYYLRARQYDPVLMRFTARDGVAGTFEQPMSLHRYLYCENEPVSRIDLSGLLYEPPALNNNMSQTRQVIDYAVDFVRQRGFPNGPIEAFSWRGYEFDYKFTEYTFQISKNYVMEGSEFTNWLTGYTCTYLYGDAGVVGSRFGGNFHALKELGHFDEPESRYFLAGGILMGDRRRWEETGELISDWNFVNAKFDLYYGIERIASTDWYSTDFDRELELYITFWNSGVQR